ncbi:efflux RND transporter periplasmic adaptor subunit [Mesorhizobium sp. J428]|uniref:efflux RND transporter periplasmic adaptor subunit n=1 Tax=Mesorhizobium sp. J428 TaxID=2898440 RepID=UPI002151E45A|nr:efflux RND transporter periplasmic adaptor subunit [Mesorhizobium sp. J428]MCR5859477.1 efflux RND transporter periplasmic adaptor subunit [Mesorhizobium sp. J428]
MDQIVSRAKADQTPQVAASLALDRKAPRRLGRWLFIALVLAAVAAGGWWYWSSSTSSTAPVYVTAAAERGDITTTITATGTLQPVTQVDVSSELSGVVRTVEVSENQTVAKGDVLLTLDTTRRVAQVERAEASVEAARAKVEDARVTLKETELTYDRTLSLSQRGMVADQALETATAARDRAASAVSSAQANLSIAEADLKLQQADLAQSTIYAPIDGVVLTRDVDPGQTVASSLSAPVLFVIAADLAHMELEAAIDEADIGTVEKGQKASFTVDAFPGRTFDAGISDLAYASVTTDGVVTYEAKLAVANDDLILRPGMTATVSVVTREAKDVLTVPSEAFRFRPPAVEASRGFNLQTMFMPRPPRSRAPQTAQPADGSRTLYVLRDGAPTEVRVRTGSTDGRKTEILSGLEEGDQVIVSTRQRRS